MSSALVHGWSVGQDWDTGHWAWGDLACTSGSDSDARPCPLPVTALIWLGMVWRPLAVCPLLASVQARFGLEAGDSPGGRGVSGGHYNITVHTLNRGTSTKGIILRVTSWVNVFL